jgi:hypothetical protein
MSIKDDEYQKVTFNEAKYYLTSRIMSFTVLGGVSGLSMGHYIGDSMTRLGPAWAIGGGVLGLQFFGGALILKAIRGKDDVRNYATSGAVTCITTLKYFEFIGVFRKSGASKAALAGVVGLIGGIFYNYGSEFLFSGARHVWLENRQHLKHVTAERKPAVLPKRPLSRELIGKVPPLQEGMSFEPEEETPSK